MAPLFGLVAPLLTPRRFGLLDPLGLMLPDLGLVMLPAFFGLKCPEFEALGLEISSPALRSEVVDGISTILLLFGSTSRMTSILEEPKAGEIKISVTRRYTGCCGTLGYGVKDGELM